MSTPELRLPPPGLNFTEIIEPGLVFSLMGAFFSGALLPLLIFLFVFSTSAARRRPIFILNVVVIILGLGLGVTNTIQEWSNLVRPEDAGIPNPLTLANISLLTFSPLVIDSILVVRIIVLHPRKLYPLKTLGLVLAFPVVVKIGRLICATIFVVNLSEVDSHYSITLLASRSWFRNPYLVSEWMLQMADNLYSMSIFTWRLVQLCRNGEKCFLVRDRSLLDRIHRVFIIALANFVFPLFLNITQIVLIARDRVYTHGSEIMMGNMYVSIIGVLFATVWARGNAWGRNNEHDRSALEITFSESPRGAFIKRKSEVARTTGTSPDVIM